MSFQLPPAVDHCHVPCAVAALPVMAMPANALGVEPPVTLSSASEKWVPNAAEIKVPAGLVVSSSIAASDAVLPLTAFGASFTGLMVSLSATVPPLYGLVPPKPLTSAGSPLTIAPWESSTTRTVRAGVVPLKLVAGRKRTKAFGSSSSACVSLTAGSTLVQVVPSVDHCHVPSAAVAALAVPATPAKLLAAEPPATWSAASEKCGWNRVATVVAGGLVACLSVGGSVSVAPTTVGASFTAVTLIAKLSLSVSPGLRTAGGTPGPVWPWSSTTTDS